MKNFLWPLALATMLTGCATAVSPINGGFYTNVKAPMLVTDNPDKPTKIGRASVRTILGVYAVGDASIEAAAKNAGITRIHHVDYQSENILGVVADFTVIVYGN
ncbi:TRL-like family protein [Agitococcus lubricus]|uniref:TRL (tRNA-associated locus)-like protein n=1 Tax=Agitococcus lubricus TaxID=1077255 RepID=A0A2T5J393_9GAMM|nr:TRL-like family protein [Agitococcus lubricus]PTQ91075.1 TRL (tRNA-associated locus)-like protein [Agitococcus lubricus]